MDCEDIIDAKKVRSYFPALAGGTALFNNASGTVVLKDAIERSSQLMYSLPMPGGVDTKSMEAINAYVDNKREVAAFLNASRDEISLSLNDDCEIICSTLCHEAAASAWINFARDLGITIKWWSPNHDHLDGPHLTVESLKPLLTSRTRIVTYNRVSNVIGTIHPILEIADAVHRVPGCMLIVDGVACVPHRPVDVKAVDVDLYCFSWYKAFGPHMGTLYASRKAQDRYMTSINHYFVPSTALDGKLYLGMPSFELQIMCSPIVRYLQNDVGWEVIIAQETLLIRVFLNYLLSKPSVYRVFGRQTSDPDQRVSVVTFEVLGRESGDIVTKINTKNRFRVVYAECLAPRPTRDVLKPRSSDGLIRVSFVHYNTIGEVTAFCDELDDIVTQADRYAGV
ncbi:hypothetical protein N7501_006007 [Penicillium viridicatum]|nr:hypothetical protein N7501_006007 [Penicillium viridicatum]